MSSRKDPAPAGAWGKAPSNAVRAAPTAPLTSSASSSSSQRSFSNGRGGGGGDRPRSTGGGRQHGRGRGGRGRGSGRDSGRGGSGSFRKSDSGGSFRKAPATNLDHVKLCQDGQGTTDAQKKVKRYQAALLLKMRLDYLDASEAWNPPPEVEWKDDEREEILITQHHEKRRGGEVTLQNRRPKPKETAPPLEECKPLEVNEETRWKSKVMDPNDAKAGEEDSDEVILKKALMLLNKLSLTTFDKLSQEFVDLGIARSDACLKDCVELIVENAHLQPHFASMYALLCRQLNEWQVGGRKVFKKLLLAQCQEEFEKDTGAKVEEAIAGIADPEEREYQAALIKKNYLGHMRFIGELYKNDMIKIDIMLSCLDTLLEKNDEEQLECFCKLMTTSGASLEQQALALKDSANKPASHKKLQVVWKHVSDYSKSQTTSNRIRFMLQDLEDLRKNGWVERRETLKAKTLSQIHKEVAKEERAASQRSGSSGKLPSAPSSRSLGSRRASAGDVRILDKKPIVDSDGFTQVQRTSSSTSLQQAMRGTSLKRATSVPNATTKPSAPPPPAAPPAPSKYLPPEECADKAQQILKEYFVSSETDDTVLCIDELVGVNVEEGYMARGLKVIEGGTLLVMERKEEDVEKFCVILLRCLKENKIHQTSIAAGLTDPLEFLADIEIDAPLARKHLITIIAKLVAAGEIKLDFLLEAPDEFVNDPRAAQFCAKVVKAMGEDAATDAHVQVIEKLMTDDDKKEHATGRDLLASL